MKTAIRDSNVELLERDLQQSLEGRRSEEFPCNIQCSLKVGTLLVTCEHGEDVELKQEQIFKDLQQVIIATQPAFDFRDLNQGFIHKACQQVQNIHRMKFEVIGFSLRVGCTNGLYRF